MQNMVSFPMKMTGKETTPTASLQPVFHKVAENLYRLESSGGYYALVKKGGKQFRRSLKTKDRKLADRPNAEFLTPLSKLARTKLPASVRSIAVSTSASNDKQRLGLSKTHEDGIFDEIHLYFLLAGLQISYGGALQPDITKGTNFTHRLFELVRGYSPLARAAGATGLKPIVNFAPWPLRLSYGDEEAKLFGFVAELIEGAQPPLAEVKENDADLFPVTQSIFALPDTVERRLAWARGLTAMRWQITRQTQAKVVLGGTLVGFRGIYPGVVEEAWMSVIAKQPLYLIGAFGGAALAVIDLLQGRDRPDMRTENLVKTGSRIFRL